MDPCSIFFCSSVKPKFFTPTHETLNGLSGNCVQHSSRITSTVAEECSYILMNISFSQNLPWGEGGGLPKMLSFWRWEAAMADVEVWWCQWWSHRHQLGLMLSLSDLVFLQGDQSLRFFRHMYFLSFGICFLWSSFSSVCKQIAFEHLIVFCNSVLSVVSEVKIHYSQLQKGACTDGRRTLVSSWQTTATALCCGVRLCCRRSRVASRLSHSDFNAGTSVSVWPGTWR